MILPLPQEPVDYYRKLLLRHFEQNRLSSQNPDAVFFYGFSEKHIDDFTALLPTALQQLGRSFGTVCCIGKTHRQIYLDAVGILGGDVPDTADTCTASNALDDTLLYGNCTLIVQELSKSRASHKPRLARSLIKTLDDAHFKGFKVLSDIIFIDRAGFLEKAWIDIGEYLKPVAPFNALDAWGDELFQISGGPTLAPI